MACCGQNEGAMGADGDFTTVMPCEVCKKLDGNEVPQYVMWSDTRQAYICKNDWPNFDRQSKAFEKRVCEVCRRLDGDNTKKSVRFCSDCDAWICDADWNNWIRRPLAAFNKIIKG